MSELLERLRVPVLFAALLLLSLGTMTAERRAARSTGRELAPWSGVLLEIAAPVQRVVIAPVDLARDLWRGYVVLVDLQAENERLRGRVSALQEENLQYKEALLESGRLGEIAALRDEFQTDMVAAEVVGGDVSPLLRSVLLDRGRVHGLRSGMPVVTGQGLAGLVTATAPHAVRVMLLLDRQSAVDGMVQRSRAPGIVHGQGTGELRFEFAVRGDDVQVGDAVISSGLGGVYPKGLRIGEVVEVSKPDARLLQEARLRPSVDFQRLEQAYVMRWRSPTMELLYTDEDEAAPRASRAGARPGS